MTRSTRFRALLNATALTTLGAALLVASAASAGDISGTIIDAATKKPVAGANVTIPGTNYFTTTDANGAYVLKDVPAGKYTVEANASDYQIGGTTQVVGATGTATLNFSAYQSASTQVTIVANRFSAKTMQVKSDNSISVLSQADLQHTAVHNAAEVLGLLPSVNVLRTGNAYFGGVDGAARGEGQFVSVRSLNAEYNVNLINGTEVATAQPYSRGVQLNLIPPGGLQTVVLNKASMADMDGDAIGGTVDFRTPTAFDYHGKEGGSISISGNYESQANALHTDDAGFSAAGEFQRKFGADQNFGVYASAYYNVRNYANSEVAGVTEARNDGAWSYAYVDANGNIPAGMDPARDMQEDGFNVGVVSGRTELFGGTLSLDWRPDVDTTYYLHAVYAHDHTTENSSLDQIAAQGTVNSLGTSVFNANGTLNTANYVPVGTGANAMYQTIIPSVNDKYWYETNPESANLSTIDLGMHKTWGAWHISPDVFYSYGRNDRPNHLETWTAAGAQAYGGTSLVSYGSNNFPTANLLPGMLGYTQNPGTQPATGGYELTSAFSDQRKEGAKIDATYDVNGDWLQSVSFGAKYVGSKRSVEYRDWTAFANPAANATLASDGLVTGYYPGFPGEYNYMIPDIDHNLVRNRFNALTDTPALLNAAGDICVGGGTAHNDYINNNCNTQSGTEDVSAAYLMAKFSHGPIEIIPGIRYESTEVHNTYFVRDIADNDADDGFQSNSSHFSKFLPSIFLNYRPDSGAVYRASIWTSYTRPPFFQLAGNASQTVDPSSGVTTISEGNPNLKAIDAVNLDASGTWRSHQGGYLSIGLFYKKLQHYIYDADGNSAADPSSTLSGNTLIDKPENGGDATVEGIEFDAQQKLNGLAPPLDGFSIGGNLTVQTSKADLGTSWGHDERMQNAPNETGNFGVYYAKDKVSFDVLYHYAGEYIANYDRLNQGATYDDMWVRPTQSLDMHAGYDFGKVKLDISAANLLNDYSYWAHIGHHTLAISDIVQAGRTVVATLKYDF